MNGDVQSLRRMLSLVALVFIVVAVVYVLLPFKFADTVPCGPPLLGAKPRTTQGVGLIRPEEECRSMGKNRLITSAFVVLIASTFMGAVAFVSPVSQACLNGRHDDCRAWWPMALGKVGQRLGCGCTCHSR